MWWPAMTFSSAVISRNRRCSEGAGDAGGDDEVRLAGRQLGAVEDQLAFLGT